MFERFVAARNKSTQQAELRRLVADCRQLLGERGEANSAAIAARALAHYRKLGAESVQQFFEKLAADFDPDPKQILELAQSYAASRSPQDQVLLFRAVESPRQELLRRLNRAPEGAAAIVEMRARLLERLRQEPNLAAVDADFEHLLSSWFNPGFLRLVQVDWRSPALLLEKLVMHEAVHQIEGWKDLRRRLEPDRRCFAFFHPALSEEPLIFVEVALLAEVPAAIAPLLDRKVLPDADARSFKTAVFYSISNCQSGLRGVNLGNFLIKQVAQELHREFPGLKTFCTLSPIPGFARWLAGVQEIASEQYKPAAIKRLNQSLQRLRERHGADPGKWLTAESAPAAPKDAEAGGAAAGAARRAAKAQEAAREEDIAAISGLCAFYLCETAHGDGRGSDPVARFHLNNGARLERINALGDISRKGLRESCGFMVNYLYDLDEVEENHQKFVAGEVRAARAVRTLI